MAELFDFYFSRFGKIAVEKGYLTLANLQEALCEQVEDDLSDRPHRVVGAICFDRGWMTLEQIDEVLKIMSHHQQRSEDADQG